MSLYIVAKANPYLAGGTVLELLDDGFQKVKLDSKGKVVGHEGLVFLEEMLMPFCIRMLNKGFDDPKLRRKSGRGYTGQSDGKWEEMSEELEWGDAQARLH
jgi:hypothetical protein